MNHGQKIITNSFSETQKLGEDFAKNLKERAVICLHGDLGSGKTTFTQGFAKGLEIKNKIISPTFIIIRTYVIPDLPVLSEAEGIRNPEDNKLDSRFRGNDKRMFYHIDLYRIENEKDVEGLGILEIINDPENIVIIEWSEKIEHLLPSRRINVVFNYIDEDKRKIIFE
jgi:tRNA threonylcarbamoyladenosine biosynthesis protein TsaE